MTFPVMLAAKSEYFRAMYLNHFREKNQLHINETESFEHFEVLKAVVDAMYDIPLTFTLESAPGFIRAAHFTLR